MPEHQASKYQNHPSSRYQILKCPIPEYHLSDVLCGQDSQTLKNALMSQWDPTCVPNGSGGICRFLLKNYSARTKNPETLPAQASQESRHLSRVDWPEMTPKLAGINFSNFLSVASFCIICPKPSGGLFICFPTGPRHVYHPLGTLWHCFMGVFCQLDFELYSAASGELKMFVLYGIFHCDPMEKVAKVWDPNPTPQHSLQVPISTSGTNSLLHPAMGSRLASGSLCSHPWPWWNPPRVSQRSGHGSSCDKAQLLHQN